jgi:trans-aconitate 2-methyltransferase
MWDPTTYLAYADERGRPFHDLVARIGAGKPRAVTDLGCGPGNLTMTLASRWPDSAITGIDSSAEMISQARASAGSVNFRIGDVRDWHPAPGTDVVLSNATLQWVPGHDALLRNWAAALEPGAWLAFQVPGNFDAPSHQALRAIAASREDLASVLRHDQPVLDPAGYADVLKACTVDAWETTYLHILPAGPEHPVLSWMEGTALRPVRAALDVDAWTDFRAALGERLAEEYPVRDGRVLFPFRRVFVVAQV